MNNGKLILAPKDPMAIIKDWQAFIERLQEMEFINQHYDSSKNIWLAGDRFMQWIGFMGCSPFILLKPDGDKPFCHVCLPQPRTTAILRWGDLTRDPKCKQCKKLITHWHVNMSDQKIICPSCESIYLAKDFTWRRNAGLACCFIEISNIFQGEAVPVDAFFQKLEILTGIEWIHFYLQNEA